MTAPRKDCGAIYYYATRNFLENYVRLATTQPRRWAGLVGRVGCHFTMSVVAPIITAYP